MYEEACFNAKDFYNKTRLQPSGEKIVHGMETH